MTPAALDALLSRACALGSTLEHVLAHMNSYVPCIVKWDNERRKSLCGPWNSFADCARVWNAYAHWIVFDYEIYEYENPTVIIHIKRYESGVKNGEGQAY